MIQTVSKLYEGTQLSRTTLQLMFLRVPVSGTIKSVYIYCGSNIAVGSSVFNLRINGAQQWTGENRPSIGAGNFAVSKTGLNIDVARGAVVYLDLEQSAQSGTPVPIALVIEIDDGISAGANDAEDISVDESSFVVIDGDNVQDALDSIDDELVFLADDISAKQNTLVSGTNIKTINSQSLLGSGNISISGGGSGTGSFEVYGKPSDIHAKSDYFEGDTLDAKWLGFHDSSASFSVADGALNISQVLSSDAISGKIQPLTSGDFTIIARMFYPPQNPNYLVGGISLHENPVAAPNSSKLLKMEVFTTASTHKIALRYFNTWQTYGDQYAAATINPEDFTPIYLMFTRSGTTISAKYSKSGRIFSALFSVTHSEIGYTPTYFGIDVNNVGGLANATWNFDLVYYSEVANDFLHGGLT